MKELSLHILDLVQNSIQANAGLIGICIDENIKADSFSITISDNGSGMSKDTIAKILDPFFTTKNKKTGLGIPLLKQHAELAGGNVTIQSETAKGTTVKAILRHAHFDRQPLGDMIGTFTGLIRAYPGIDFIYEHSVNEKSFVLKTSEIKEELQGVPIVSPEVIEFIKEMMEENLKAINQS